MKKTISLLALLLTFAVTAIAGPVEPEKALEIANSFWRSVPGLKLSELLLSPVGPSKSAGRDGVQTADAQYYLFTPEDKSGFVIVSGEDCLSPVVGYSTTACAGEMPPALVDWLADYSNFVDDVRAGVVTPERTTTGTGKAIEPLLKTSWNQSAPYNNYCPEVNRQRTPTGCTATAAAQVMKFHNWPEKPTKGISWYNNIKGTTETIDITQNTYKWSDMLNHYRSGYTAEQADAVARLMVDVGKAIKSVYAISGTSSSDIQVARALVDVFDYSSDIRVYKRNECTYDEFISIIRENLEARQPLVYSGQAQSYVAGHAFVCDGIDENNLLHIDWGWDGAYNGYFDMGSMAPGGSGIGGGQDRYNVVQSIVANIRPRSADDVDRVGDPSLYYSEVLDITNNNAVVDEYTSKFISGNASFRLWLCFLNWSHSPVKMRYGLSITSADGTFSNIRWASGEVSLPLDKELAYYYDLNVNNANSAYANYLKEGRYNIEVVYKVGNGEPVKMCGENNCFVLEVGKDSARLCKARPALEVSAFKFRTAPKTTKDNVMSFDVAFRNNNSNNATVVIVPVINRLDGDAVVERDTLASAGEVVNAFDNTDLLVTYNVDKEFSYSGDYYVSFLYDLKNSYTNLKPDVDKKRLKSIEGNSGVFTLGELSDGPLTVSSISVTSSTVGASLIISATLKNTATEERYTGTVGIFAGKEGKEVLLMTKEINIAKGSTTMVKYIGTAYVPAIGAGTYETYACELVDGKWKRINYSNQYTFTMKAPAKSVLYAASRIVIDDDNVAVQGDSVDVVAKIGCTGADFDGFVKIDIASDSNVVLVSDYVPVSIKSGEAVDVVLNSLCGATAPMGEYTKFAIKYYDTGKNLVGTMSNNTIEYPGNGNFWVADETAVDEVSGEGAAVVVGDGCITVGGEVAFKVSSVDGRIIYSGAAATVPVERGVYVVAVENTDGNVAVKKVVVK